MSLFDIGRNEGPRGGPLDEREIQVVTRLLSDPFAFPAEFWTAVKTRLENDPPAFDSSAIIGFSNSVGRSLPVRPVVDLAVDISATNTDLPGPGQNVNSVWMINPGGGTLRSIGEPAGGEGARITLKGSWIGTTTIEHNDVGGGGNQRPLFLSGQANKTITDVESIELVYMDTTWQDVGGAGGAVTVTGEVAVSIGSANTDLAAPPFPLTHLMVTTVGGSLRRIANTGVEDGTCVLIRAAVGSGTFTILHAAGNSGANIGFYNHAVGGTITVYPGDTVEAVYQAAGGGYWVVTNVYAKPRVQVGQHYFTNVPNNTAVGSGTITFPIAFPVAPTVVVGLSAMNNESSLNNGVWCTAEDITASNFRIVVCGGGLGSNDIGVNWIASLPF